MAWGYLFVWPLTEGGVSVRETWLKQWSYLHFNLERSSPNSTIQSASASWLDETCFTLCICLKSVCKCAQCESVCWCMKRAIAVLPWQRWYFLSNATTHLYLAYSLTFLHIIMVRSGHTRFKMKFLLFDMWPKLDLVIIYVHFVFKRCFNISSQCQEAEVYFCTSSFMQIYRSSSAESRI